MAGELGWAKTYDANYVALARILDYKLVTLDARLRRGTARLGFVIGPTEPLRLLDKAIRRVVPRRPVDRGSLRYRRAGRGRRGIPREIRATLPARARSPRERRIVLLRFVTGLSQREVAARVGFRQMNVSQILRHSLDRLQAAVG